MSRIILRNKMTKSNATEIISVLYWILASQMDNQWLMWLFILLGIENMIESAVWARVHKTKDVVEL